MSLLAVVISVAVLTIVGAGTAAGIRSVLMARRAAQISASSSDIEGTFADEVISAFNSGTTASACFNPNGMGTLNVGTYGTAALWRGNGFPAYAGTPAEETAAAGRCGQMKVPGSASAAASSTHFCIRFTPAAGVAQPVGSFFSSSFAFAEIELTPEDFRTRTPISCKAYRNTPTLAGLAMVYTLYWSANDGPQTLFKRKSGIVYGMPR
jgi:hypothetical protein